MEEERLYKLLWYPDPGVNTEPCSVDEDSDDLPMFDLFQETKNSPTKLRSFQDHQLLQWRTLLFIHVLFNTQPKTDIQKC